MATHRPVSREPNCWIGCTPDFAILIKSGDPNKIVLLAVVDDCDCKAITFPKYMNWYRWVQLRQHQASSSQMIQHV